MNKSIFPPVGSTDAWSFLIPDQSSEVKLQPPPQLGDKSPINVRSLAAALAYRVFMESEGNFLYILQHLSICLILKSELQGSEAYGIDAHARSSYSLVRTPNRELL